MDSIDNIIISLFIKPNIIVNNILELTSDELDYLKTLGIKGLILDVDETLRYNMKIEDEPKFYIPKIIENDEELKSDWLKDINSLKDLFPQGMLVKINERGTVEDFILKCKERLCGCAQLEIMLQTKEILDKYIENTKNTNKYVYEYLLPYERGVRCTFKGWKCASPCIWGAKNSLTRKI